MSESAGRPNGHNGTGKSNRYLARAVGEAAVSPLRTDTFLGEGYRRITRRRGKKRAIVAIGRSILVIVWALFSDAGAQYVDLAPATTPPAPAPSARSANTSARLHALGYTVTSTPAA